MDCVKKLMLGWIVVLFYLNLAAQTYPTDYFILPVKHTFRCSGSFGELRNNHFHMGVDIKSSKGVSGDEILASADGYISRISINAGGYGNVLYIDHPNGYRTVYAHLSRFTKPVSDYIRAYQYKNKSFENNIYPPPDKFTFKQGEVIGKMGNSGRSFGPHLHFEIRESATDIPINPMLFGIKPADEKDPVLKNLKVMEWDSTGILNKTSFYPLRKVNGEYTIGSDTLFCQSDSVKFALEVYDRMNGSNNKNGIYRIQMQIDSQRAYDFIMHKISFDDSDYFNAHIDYYEWKNSDSFFTNLYKLTQNPLPIFNTKIDQQAGTGMSTDITKVVDIMVSDIEKNKSTLSFKLVRSLGTLKSAPTFGNYIILPSKDQWLHQENWLIRLPSGTFIDKQNLIVSAISDSSFLSQSLKIGNDNVPIFKPYEVHNQEIDIDSVYWSKLCIIKCDEEENLNYGGEVVDSMFSSRLTSLGTFQTHLDTIPPKITNVNLNKNMRGRRYIRIEVTEELKAARKNLRFTYKAWIDGEWILMEHDEKNNHLTYYFDNTIEKGDHSFKLETKDWAGNRAVYEQQFSY